MKNLFQKQVSIFIIIGIINTLIGTSIMFGLYNLAGFNYWISSSFNYIFTSILSYFLNRKYTFKFKGSSLKSMLKFAINIATCYIVAYGLSKLLVISIFQNKSVVIQDNISMIVGMVLFTSLNFIGQKYFAFK